MLLIAHSSPSSEGKIHGIVSFIMTPMMPQNLGLAQRKSTRFSIQLDIPNVHVRQRKASANLVCFSNGFL
jgi:hypothetical protein